MRDTLKGGSQTIGHPDAGHSYWRNEEKEVTYNGGRTPHRVWAWDRYNGITHTQGTGNGPLERPNSVDPYEEHELVIDLDTDTDSSYQSEDTQPPVTLTPQVHSGQPRPQSTRQCRTNEVWFPEETASSSDDTHEEHGPLEPEVEVDLYAE